MSEFYFWYMKSMPNHSGLVQKDVTVTREGTTFTRRQWVRPDEAESTRKFTKEELAKIYHEFTSNSVDGHTYACRALKESGFHWEESSSPSENWKRAKAALEQMVKEVFPSTTFPIDNGNKDGILKEKYKDIPIGGNSSLSKLSKEAVLKTTSHIFKALEEYPQLKGYIVGYDLTRHGGLLATSPTDDLSGVILRFNPVAFSDVKQLQSYFLEDYKAGASPKNTTWEQVGVHEIGHIALAKIIHDSYSSITEREKDWNEDFTAKQIVKRAMKSVGFPTDAKTIDLQANHISSYAVVSRSETVSEAILDCYVNRVKSQPISQAIIKELKEWF